VGLGQSPLGLYLAYMRKMWPALGEPWEEAHEGHILLEMLKAGARAIAGHHHRRGGGLRNSDLPKCSRGAKGEGKDGEGESKQRQDGEKPMCFNMRDYGKCDNPNCGYDHDRARVRAAHLAKQGATRIITPASSNSQKPTTRP
jgi:hypothetical protein